jgi:hypothetical protein
MDAYDRLTAINEALISIEEKKSLMGRLARAAQTIGATARKATRSGTVFTPRGAQTRSRSGRLRMPRDVMATNQPDRTLGYSGSVGSRIRGQMKSVKQKVKKIGGIVTRGSGEGGAGTLDMGTGRAKEMMDGRSDALDVGSVGNINTRTGRIGPDTRSKRGEQRGTVVGTTDKMTPREKVKALKQMRRNRDAADYGRGLGDTFKGDQKELSDLNKTIPMPGGGKMSRRGAQRGANRIETTGRSDLRFR